ncbi:MAG: methyltransferase domain-containing protein [Candidatus Chisholmbacteria bacterium]|nr:methyltransferase domain-containing protein [Candidatus Chisholmbacteria bacterium]
MQKCRLCHHPVIPFLSFGRLPLPEELRLPSERHLPLRRYPLGLATCSQCHHVQLTQKVRPDTIYKQHYHYDCSLTATNYWLALAKSFARSFENSRPLVVDIGSNTGLLLHHFRRLGCRVLGIDPSPLARAASRRRRLPLINKYFSPQLAQRILTREGPAQLITCTNTFDHVSSLTQFTRGLTCLLHPQGTCLIEVPYFLSFIKDLNHVVYHQQIDYCLLTPLIPFFARHGLQLHSAETTSIHGGSLRLTLGHQPSPLSQTTKKLLAQERRLFHRWPQVLRRFSRLLLARHQTFRHRLLSLINQGKSVAAIAASAKGITILNYCHLDYRHIQFITEASPTKIGRFTPSGIPIVSDRYLLKHPPDVALLLAFNFAAEILPRLKSFTARGGRIILP